MITLEVRFSVYGNEQGQEIQEVFIWGGGFLEPWKWDRYVVPKRR